MPDALTEAGEELGQPEDERPIDVAIGSSAIAHAHYDPGSQTLTLTFHRGIHRRYALRGVSRETFDRFLASPSKGRFFQDELRGQYG